MPHIRFRAIAFDTVKHLSTALVDDLQPIMQCPREDFTLEHIPASFIFDGEVSDAYPLLKYFGLIVAKRFKILWLKRLLR